MDCQSKGKYATTIFFQRSDTVCQGFKDLPGAWFKCFAAVPKLLLFPCALTRVLLIVLLSRFSHTGHPCTALTCWMTPAAWLCSWWASCCSPLSWSWHSLRTVAWPDTSSWACASFPTAVLSIRTCLLSVAGALGREDAAVRKVPPRETGRGVCGFEKSFCKSGYFKLQLSCFVVIIILFFPVNSAFFICILYKVRVDFHLFL